jgi:hypothetical protein
MKSNILVKMKAKFLKLHLKSQAKKLQLLGKLFFATLFVAILLQNFVVVKAQSEEQYFPPALGPILGYKGSINGFTNPQGRKNGFAFNNVPDFGASIYLPLDFVYNLGLYVDLMYNTNSFLQKYNYDGIKREYDDIDKMRFSYVTISPKFSHAGFMLGFSYGIPVSADWEGANISTEKLNNLIEVKAGYSYPIYFDEIGRLNLFINASYALNGTYKNFEKNDPLKNVVPAISPQIITSYYNPRPAGIQIGVNFLFNLIILPEEYYEY